MRRQDASITPVSVGDGFFQSDADENTHAQLYDSLFPLAAVGVDENKTLLTGRTESATNVWFGAVLKAA